jgi:sigma-B regulation protein RsbU (phosphoserine phosphatase)
VDVYCPIVSSARDEMLGEEPRQERQTVAERLRRIESVTDASLGHLDVEDLLNELLARVCDALEVDTATVLLLDAPSGDLVATATQGIEEEVRQGVRVPLGAGFAGRIAAEGTPVVIEDVDDADLYNPLLRTRGLRSLLGAPLVNEGRMIGVIHVGSLRLRRFGPEDVDLLQTAANMVALAVTARQTNVDRAAAAALQRSLIPAALPAVPGLELAARYLPAGEGGVGGDWYDVFVLPGGEVGIVMGDVVGRGLAAAVVMGRLRSALRAYALEVLDPAAVLERLDRKLQHFERGQMTTVLYGVVDATLTSIRLATAGHPLPLIAMPRTAPFQVDAPVDVPLGVLPGRRRRQATIELCPGTMMAFFTDGLVERRGEVIDRGITRVGQALVRESARLSCRAILAELVPAAGWADDAALLVIRRKEPS